MLNAKSSLSEATMFPQAPGAPSSALPGLMMGPRLLVSSHWPFGVRHQLDADRTIFGIAHFIGFIDSNDHYGSLEELTRVLSFQ